MNITVAAVGKQKFSYLQEAESEYLKRISHYADISIERIKETTPQHGEWFLKRAEGRVLIVLDEQGKEMDSKAFAKFIGNLRETNQDIVFAIGAHDGIPKNVTDSATHVISLSQLTFTHLLVPTILLEQVYRAFTLLGGHPYHRH